MSDGYADLLRRLLPGAVVDICYPADPGANLPIGGLEGYDGVAITGSALNVYDGGPEIARQIELAREVLKAKTPLFGSCWGLQVITVAAGGTVRRQSEGPRDRDRAAHRAHAGRARASDVCAARARCSTPSRCISTRSRRWRPAPTVLAANAQSDVQAAEIKVDGAVAWGVQYHPEFSLADMAAIVRRYGARLIQEGFFADEAARDAYVADLEALDREPGQQAARLALRHRRDACSIAGVRIDRDRQLDHASGAAGAQQARAREVGPVSDKIMLDGTYRDRHVVVTGGTGALGTAVVGALIEAGATCHVPYRSEDEAKRFPHRDSKSVSLVALGDLPTRRR